MSKVSVIIPFFNENPAFLEQAVLSVLNQTLDDIEIICIDDGSDSETCFDMLKQYKIKLFKKPHTGSGDSRNLGIKESTGENIMFLDSDDYYPDNKVLEKLYYLKKTENVTVAGGKHLILNNEKFEEPYFNYGNINDFFCNKKVKYSDYQFPWWYWCFMFDSELIKSNNITFPPYLRYQDPPFFVRIMDKADIFYAADFVSYIHRTSPENFSLTKENVYDHIKGILDVLEYSGKNRLYKLNNLLYSAFFNFDLKIINKIQELSLKEKEDFIKLIESSRNLD